MKNSVTFLSNIYPTGTDGPLINYKRDGLGVHMWQFDKTQLFVRFVTRDGKLTTQPLGTRVLAVSYQKTYLKLFETKMPELLLSDMKELFEKNRMSDFPPSFLR